MFAKSMCLVLLITTCVINPAIAQAKSLVPIKKWETKSGMPVFYAQEPELPIVDIQVVFDAGSARDSDQLGLAKITNEALSSGTSNKSADAIAIAFDNVGARYSSAVNRDMAVVALRSLSDPKFFESAFKNFTDVVTNPSFPNNEFLRIKKQTLSTLEEQEQMPSSIASKAFYNAVFNNSPYGHPVSGTKSSVKAFTANDLRNFYQKCYVAQNGFIAIVGNLDEAQARRLSEELSSKLNKGASQPDIVFKSLAQKQSFQHITFPSSQTNVMIGQVGINRNATTYFPVVVGNYILGGGSLTSRLFDEVREKRGLAYTVRSQFNALKGRGPFIIELQTRNSEANNAIQVVTNTLNKFVAKGPSQQELISAKKNLTQGFVLRLASNSAIMGQLINIGFYHLPLDYLDTYTSNISKVTDQQVRETFQKIIHPNDMATVTVGNTILDTDGKKTT